MRKNNTIVRPLIPLVLVLFWAAWAGCAGRNRLAGTLLKGTALEPLSPFVEFTNFRTVGSSATADGTVRTGFRFARENDRWVLKEVRLGDRQWENIQDIREALDSIHTRRTLEEMRRVLEGVQRYRAAKGSEPTAADFVELIDLLSPDYLNRVIRLDGWRRAYRMSHDQGRLILTSDGPDGKEGTPDDIRMP